jgi:uncharacterized protein (TIGR03067 family)
MRLIHVWFTVGGVTAAMMALGGAAADEPKAGEGAAVKQLQAVWKIEALTADGKKQEGDVLDTLRGMTLTIDGDRAVLKAADGATVGTYEMTFDASKDPKTFDAKEVQGASAGSVYKGIWKIEGDTLLWCFSPKDRPKKFESKEGTDVTLIVHKRQKPK